MAATQMGQLYQVGWLKEGELASSGFSADSRAL